MAALLSRLFGQRAVTGVPDPAFLHLYNQHEAEAQARAAQITQRWRWYHGQHPKPLRVRQGQPDDTVILNYARIIVDKGVSFLFGKDVQFELDETGETAAEEWLAACWERNRQATLLQKLALNGAIAGHTFLKILPQQPYPRLVVLDPATVSVVWDPDDLEVVLRYIIQYPAIDPQTEKPVLRRQRIERGGRGWQIIDQQQQPGQSGWVTLQTTVWPYAWPPILDGQNLPCPNEYWGISDLEDDILQLNAALNFVASNLTRIIRYHAHPKTWGRGFAASQLNIAVDETIVLSSPDAELRNLEMTSDLSSSVALFQRLREALHEISKIPEVATGRLENAGSLSGVALQILYQPLVEKTELKRRTYGDFLVELNRRLLVLGGFGEENRVTIHWPELLPADPLQERQIAVLDQQLGVSQDTLLQRLGYDPDLERQKREAGSAQLGEQLLTAFERGE